MLKKVSILGAMVTLQGCNSATSHLSQNNRTEQKYVIRMDGRNASKPQSLNVAGDTSNGNFKEATIGLYCVTSTGQVAWEKNFTITALNTEQPMLGFACNTSPMAVVTSVSLVDAKVIANKVDFVRDIVNNPWKLNSLSDFKTQVDSGKIYILNDAAGVSSASTGANGNTSAARVGQVAIKVVSQFDSSATPKATFEFYSGLAAIMIAKNTEIPPGTGTNNGFTYNEGLPIKIEKFVTNANTHTLSYSFRYSSSALTVAAGDDPYWIGTVTGNPASGLSDVDASYLLVKYSTDCTDGADYKTIAEDMVSATSPNYINLFQTDPVSDSVDDQVSKDVKLRTTMPGADGIGSISFQSASVPVNSCIIMVGTEFDDPVKAAADPKSVLKIFFSVLRFK